MGMAGIRLPYWWPPNPVGKWNHAPKDTLQKPLPGVKLNPTHPLNRKVVAFWTLNENKGTIIRSLPYGIEGQNNNNDVPWVGNGLNFTGTAGKYITIPSSASATSPLRFQDHSILLRMRLNAWSVTNAKAIIGSYDTLIAAGLYEWGIGAAGELEFAYCGTDMGIHGWYKSDNGLVPINTWVTIGGTWINPTPGTGSGAVSFYKDGAFNKSVSTTAYAISYPVGTLALGYQANNDVMNGIWECFCVWNRALSRAEMQLATQFPYGTPDNPRFI